MNTTVLFAGIVSCLLLMLNVAHSFTLLSKDNTNGEDHLLIQRPYVLSPNKVMSFYQDEGSMNENSAEDDEHELEKRRFNAWAGKRSVLTKRRFNAWAGRR